MTEASVVNRMVQFFAELSNVGWEMTYWGSSHVAIQKDPSRRRPPARVAANQHIFIPLCYDFHFVLLVANRIDRCCYVYDSLRGYAEESKKHLLDAIWSKRHATDLMDMEAIEEVDGENG